MNHRDDWAEIFLHKEFSDRAEYQCVFPRAENSLCKIKIKQGCECIREWSGPSPLPIGGHGAVSTSLRALISAAGPGRPLTDESATDGENR